MPTNSRAFLKPFIGGLNTELLQVEDAVVYTSDELNCTILPEGIRGRRYGMNIERDGSWYQLDKAGTTYSGFFWKNVGKTELDIIVYQVDKTLYFYDASQKPYSVSKYQGTIDLTPYITETNGFTNYPVKFTTGGGVLMVVSKYMTPIQVSYDFDTGSFTAVETTLKYRDLEGVDDGLAVDEMPTELSDKHHYNLLNQGWSEEDIQQFYQDQSKYPANNLQWFIGKDNSGAYNTEELLKHYFGNTPAPKGHFVIDYFLKDRSNASGIYSANPRVGNHSFQNTWVRDRELRGTMINNFKISVPESSGTAKAITITFTKLLRKSAKKSYDYRWSGTVTITVNGLNSSGSTTVHTESYVVYGASSEDISIKSFTFENETKYDTYEILVSFSEGNGTSDYPNPLGVTCQVSLAMGEDGSPFDTNIGLDRITDIEYMSGKYFYLVGDTVLFSQTIKDDGSGFDKCYQDADPTSEDISDVLPTDGGYVKFQTMGTGLALKAFNRGVLVFGRDVVHGLISPLESRFTATEYDILELSKAGLIGKESVVSVSDRVFYWSPLGIFSIGISTQTNNTMVAESVSEGTIQSYYNSIPEFSKQHCKGSYDYINNRIYWFYPTDEENITKLDGCLMYDLTYNAFCPFKIASKGAGVTAVFATLNSNEIKPTMYVRAGGYRVVAGDNYVVTSEEVDTKYNRWTAIQQCIVSDDNKISFGDFNSREFIDWDSESYDSYMVTRPITLEDTYFNKQTPVLQTLFKRTEEIELNQRIKNVEILSESFIGQPEYFLAGKRYDCTLNNLNTDTSKPLNYSVKLNSISSMIAVGDTPITELNNCIVTLWRVYRNDNNVLVKSPQHIQSKENLKVGESLNIPCTKGEYGTDFEITIFIPEEDNPRMNTKTFINFNTIITFESNVPITNDKQYVAQSGAYIRMRWGWSLTDKSNRWDMIQNAYRPQKDFMEDEYVESRMHVKGRGKSFQIEIRNDKNKDFRLGGMNIVVRSR